MPAVAAAVPAVAAAVPVAAAGIAEYMDLRAQVADKSLVHMVQQSMGPLPHSLQQYHMVQLRNSGGNSSGVS